MRVIYRLIVFGSLLEALSDWKFNRCRLANPLISADAPVGTSRALLSVVTNTNEERVVRRSKRIKIEILYRSVGEFGKRSDVAIHALNPTYGELLQHIDQALKDMFPRIVVYVSDPYVLSAPRFNIHASQSTWNRLMRDLGDSADVRCGMIQHQFGQVQGEGFEVYFDLKAVQGE
jgi:hypothetical protein